VPYQQQNTTTARVTLLVRTTMDPRAVAADVQRAVWAEDPLQPIDAIAPLDDLLVGSTGGRQFQVLVLGAFAFVALTLALVGVYGVATATVKARAREVGVRLALGAAPRTIVASTVGDAAVRIAIGAATGLIVFVALRRPLGQLLYGTAATDPIVLAAAIVPLVSTALAISYRQARRLAATPPSVALRGTE
jgi:putative ABC transport system permease protein